MLNNQYQPLARPIPLYKPKGMTPLATVQAYAAERGLSPELKLGYAGRLDPLAEGLVLALVGSANKLQASLLALDKSYRFTAVFGLTTDSYDLLGLPAMTESHRPTEIDIRKAATQLIGKAEQPYPPYSAVQVQDKPLYWWARSGRLAEIAVPSKTRQLLALDTLSFYQLSSSELLSTIINDIALVKGNFRQVEIEATWQNLLAQYANQTWVAAEFEVHCSSGTYVRGVVNTMGQKLGCGATALSITRTAVGNFTLKDCYHLSL
jgi:tRNA pseudouridine55 synthase